MPQQEPTPMPRHDIGDLATWREDLTHVEQLLHIVRDRQPLAEDGCDILKNELRLAVIASLFPDQTADVFAAIARGSGGANAAMLAQRCWRNYDDEGMVILAEPERSPRYLPVGDARMSLTEWVKGLSLALIARDQETLMTLCTPASIAACSLPPQVMDAFWAFYCGALAAVVVEPKAASTWIGDAEAAMAEFEITDPLLIECRVRPTLRLAKALVEETEPFQSALSAALEAHQRYYRQPDRRRDWEGLLALEATALAALACDRGLAIEIQSDYLPRALVRGELPQELSKVTYLYPVRSISSAEEAHWFFDLVGFPRAKRSHRLIERDHQLVARYEVHDAPGIPNAIADFVLIEAGTGSAPADAATPAPALDAGELLFLAEAFASAPLEQQDITAQRQQRVLLADAIACIDMVLARIPPTQAAVAAETITSAQGRALYEAEPGRFRRDRLMAYQGAIAAALQKLDAQIQRSLAGAGGTERETEAEIAEQIAANPQATAIVAIDVIRAQVLPILEAIAHDTTGEAMQQLIPQDTDFSQVFVGEALEIARRAYRELWSQGLHVQKPTSGQSEIQCYASPAGMLDEPNELSAPFPQGYQAIAPWLNPHRVWVAWKYVQPGEQAGLAFDGLVWVDDHWVWFPKPYRVLRSLVKSPSA
jgi:Immunity protein 49